MTKLSNTENLSIQQLRVVIESILKSEAYSKIEKVEDDLIMAVSKSGLTDTITGILVTTEHLSGDIPNLEIIESKVNILAPNNRVDTIIADFPNPKITRNC